MLALKEMNSHDLLMEYPVSQEKSKGALVAQFKYTILVLPSKVVKLNSAPLPYVSSEKKVTTKEVNDVLALSLNIKKSKAPKLVEKKP